MNKNFSLDSFFGKMMFFSCMVLTACSGGIQSVEVDLSQIREPFGRKYIHTEEGVDVRTTCDTLIQRITDNVIRVCMDDIPDLEAGTAVVMEVSTGAVRAMSSLRKMDDGTYSRSFNYAANMASEPGSLMKLVSLMALLEDGCADLDTPVEDNSGVWKYGKSGILFSDTKAGGYSGATLGSAFSRSSNVAFAQMAVRHYENRPEVFIDHIHTMMPVDSLGLEFGGEVSSRVPSPGDGIWSEASLPTAAIGYGVLFTPLQILTFYNAVAGGGKMMKPYLVEAYCREGEEIRTFSPKVICPRICSDTTIAAAQAALRSVVTDGTGRLCNEGELHISGKTGLSQTAFQDDGRIVYRDAEGYRKYQTGFAGFFPSEDPEYSCIVMLYSARTRGIFSGASAPVRAFKEIADGISAIPRR